MIRTRRKSTSHLTAIILPAIVGLVLLTAGLLPASQTAIARALSLSDGTAWLEMVDKPNQLYTEYSLSHLSGRLIIFGAVDATKCENGGLNPNGEATDCGIKAAQPVANEWQNRFNAAIVETSKKQSIPPRMLKNMFAWESQFWPETTYTTAYEFGLGHMTMNGADSALRWDTALYDEICAASFTKETCHKDLYGYQPEDLRNALQGVLAQKVNADCSNCRFNLDLNKAEKSIPYIGKILMANDVYVRYAVKIFSGKDAEELVSPDDLWRFTLTSYNAGPGCYRSALSNIYYRGLNLTWSNLKKYLEPACKGSIPYVDFISKTGAYHPENDPALHPTATPEVQPTPTQVPVSLDAPHSENEVVVKIESDHLDNALKALQSLDISADKIGMPIDPSGDRVIQVPPEKLSAVLEALRSNPDIASAQPNYLVSMASLPVGYPNDPQYPGQPNLTAAQVYTAWDTLSITLNPGAPVLVAVVDSGVDSTHVDLAGRTWTNPGESNCSDGVDDDHNGYVDDCHGWDMVNRDNSPADDNGHGTEMAGVIGAVTDNATGIAGIAPNASILPVKVLLYNGVGTHSWAAEGILYAANMGAKVIYLGFAGIGDSDVLSNAIAYAVSKGAIIVAPAGNDNGAAINNYPASYPGVTSVSAVNNSGTIAAFSTSSNSISIAAPGVNILSTAPGNTYLTASGTSLAAAHIAGVAVMLAGQPQFINHNDVLRAALLSSALDVGAAGRDPVYGFGLLRANNAISALTPSATVKITSPSASAVYAQGQPITFTGLALDIASSDISSTLVWTSNIDGTIGTGASFTVSKLTPGAHKITAAVSGGSAFLDLRVMEASGPHGDYIPNTEACAACHNSHSVNGADPGSAGSSNDYCLSCHNNIRAKAVSTHGNLSSHTPFVKQEQDFEMLCIQCHDPHGATANIFAIRENLILGALPTHFQSMLPQSGAVSFTTLNPFSSASLNNLCASCHQDPKNPGFPMTSHDSGDIHNDPAIGDQTSEVCIFCHYHDLDGDPATRDGFMPAVPLAVTKQAQASPTPVASPIPGSTPIPTQAATAETPVPTARFQIETSSPTALPSTN